MNLQIDSKLAEYNLVQLKYNWTKFICVLMDKNYWHCYQLPTTYRDA